jgi:hypothetical protein
LPDRAQLQVGFPRLNRKRIYHLMLQNAMLLHMAAVARLRA